MKHLRIIKKALKAKGIQPTAQRLQVAGIMLERNQHLSADQIMDRLNNLMVSVSKATVYNTLALFTECGLVRTVSIDGSRTFYDSNTLDHSHFFNVDTGELTDVLFDNALEADLPEAPKGTGVESVELIIRVKNQI